MELNLHANATTTPKTRAYIQHSKKSVAQLAAELGVSETTIYRWRGRTTVIPSGPVGSPARPPLRFTSRTSLPSHQPLPSTL